MYNAGNQKMSEISTSWRLLNAPKDPSSSVRDQAVWDIGEFRAEARSAVPALAKAAKEDADNLASVHK